MNKKIKAEIAVGVILFLAILIGGVVYFEGKNETARIIPIVKQPQSQDQQNVKTNQTQQDQMDAQKVTDLMNNTKVYADKINRFEFQYPENYSVSTQPNNPNEYLIKDESIKNGINIIADFTVVNWKKTVIQKRTPATEYQNTAYYNWKYIFNNFSSIQAGNCDNNLVTHVPGSTIADVPKVCIVSKGDGYLKVETESSVIYYTSDGKEIIWSGSQQNINMVKEIAGTLKFINNTINISGFENWKTYSNKNFDIEMKYPPELYLSTSGNKVIFDYLSPTDPKQKQEGSGLMHFNITSIQETVNKYIADNNLGSLQNFKQEQIQLNDTTAEEITYTDAFAGGNMYMALIQNGSNLIVIDYAGSNGLEDTFNKMLSTIAKI